MWNHLTNAFQAWAKQAYCTSSIPLFRISHIIWNALLSLSNKCLKILSPIFSILSKLTRTNSLCNFKWIFSLFDRNWQAESSKCKWQQQEQGNKYIRYLVCYNYKHRCQVELALPPQKFFSNPTLTPWILQATISSSPASYTCHYSSAWLTLGIQAFEEQRRYAKQVPWS